MDDLLKLENQLCFPLYAASRLVTRMYAPYLKELNITYPQYLILLVLWEFKELSIMEIGDKLFLSTNTLTPLLKRMEVNGIVTRIKSRKDERKVLIALTKKGSSMEAKACKIPLSLAEDVGESISLERLTAVKENLDMLLNALSKNY